jgi:hypothetical protein
MPTKTDRILSFLPKTFRTSPRPPVLYPLADAFGNELLLGENSLAAIMLAHWVDFADKNEAQIYDLEKMGALYGLAPWRDESGNTLETVEEFREHLKRYVRTFLEGTVTVQGNLRIAAESLALRIADAPDQLDRWWARPDDAVASIETLGNDAINLLRFDSLTASGDASLPAQVTGNVDLSAGVNLQGINNLRLEIDGASEEIDLTEGSAPDATLTLDQIVDVINKPPRPTIASHDGRFLKLASPTVGSSSKLEVVNGPNDAAPTLLGLAPRVYHGSEATAAQYKGTPDLSDPIDLSNERYLRLEIDGSHQAEFDCAGTDASQTTLDEIRDKINNAFPGLNVADHDGHHLILTSPTKGSGSGVVLQPPASQNAGEKVLGVASFVAAGRDAQPARAHSTRDLRGRVDLSERANIRLRVDGAASITINCAGVEPDKTERVEIVAAINDALNIPAAVITERALSLSSPSTGPTSEIVFEEPDSGDATFEIFGIGPLLFVGSEPTVARLTAAPPLTNDGVDVRANNLLSLAVDGGTPVEIDLRAAADDVEESSSLPLNKLAEHINKSFGGVEIASTDGEKLFLSSAREGGVSQLEVLRRETTRKRRFVTRATITDEATKEIFGFYAKESKGTSAAGARLKGAPDLSQSVDLTTTRFLRLRVDSFPATEIDCAGPRARATTLAEVVSNINKALAGHGFTEEVATHDGKHLVLISPNAGAGSLLAIEPPRGALDELFGVEPDTFRGTDPTGVRFTSLVDLTAGIDLVPFAAIKLAIDGAPAAEIVLGEAAPVHRSAFEIANAINTTLQTSVAKTDGRRIQLISAKKGADSIVKFETPAANDVTKEVFGIAAPREYHGAAATPARVLGQRELIGTTDLSVFRFLRVSVDGQPAQTIDCAAEAANPAAATLAEIVNSIGPEIASVSLDGKRLILESTGVGATAQITLEALHESDASDALFGNNPLSSSGSSALAAIITGDKSLQSPVDLSRRGLIRIAVDGGRPVDIDVAGAVPAQTPLDEIVTRINLAIPNLATADSEGRLQLTSPGAGPGSTLSLQPLRFLEVIEYPLSPITRPVFQTKHGGFWTIENDGVANSNAEIRIAAPQGTVGPRIVNSRLRWSVHLLIVLERGETARLFRHSRQGLGAEVIAVDGTTRQIPGSQIMVGPIGSQAHVPFVHTWTLTGREEQSLQLNNPQASSIVLLKGLKTGKEIKVDVLESDLSALPPAVIEPGGKVGQLAGRIKLHNGGFRLVDGSGSPIADLLPGKDISLQNFLDQVVKAEGPVHNAALPLMLVQQVTKLFDVMLYYSPKGEPTVNEHYPGVSIGAGGSDDDSLVTQINGGAKDVEASKLVRAEELDKSSVLTIPEGRTVFRYLDCLGSRFDYAHFDYARFPNGVCGERGIFDVSRFTNAPPERIRAVFSAERPFPEPPVEIGFRWEKFSAGSFVVNLPADLPPRFGARFNEGRFGQDKGKPETYQGAVAEPPSDPKFLVKMINGESGEKSKFVKATPVGSVELGWAAVRMPFRKPQFLTHGGPGRAARIYLREDGLTGFIRLDATSEGAWGNEISISARQVSPAIYDVSVIYQGGRFEQARSIVLGSVKETIQDFMKPGPTGVLQAKAAGVLADVTRERAH